MVNGVVFVVELEIRVLVAGRHVREDVRRDVRDGALDRLRIRIDQDAPRLPVDHSLQ